MQQVRAQEQARKLKRSPAVVKPSNSLQQMPSSQRQNNNQPRRSPLRKPISQCKRISSSSSNLQRRTPLNLITTLQRVTTTTMGEMETVTMVTGLQGLEMVVRSLPLSEVAGSAGDTIIDV